MKNTILKQTQLSSFFVKKKKKSVTLQSFMYLPWRHRIGKIVWEKSAFPSARDVTEYDDVDTFVLDIAFPHGKTNFSQTPLAITFVTGKTYIYIDVMLTPSISFLL